MAITPKFASVPQSFHGELKKRIADYFKQNNSAPTGNLKLYTKAIILLVAFTGMFVQLVFYTPVVWLAILECIFFGSVIAAIGFNIMHDGAHGSFSKYKWVNDLASNFANFLGASQHMWKTKHNIIHHTYTNISGIDDDIEARPLLRLCEDQEPLKIHKYQHYYFWAAYSLLYIYWVFVTDYTKYFSGKIGEIPLKKMTTSEHLSFWFYKLGHAILFVVVPIAVVGFVPWVIGFLTMGLVTGFVLSIVFQLAHTVEHTHFPLPVEGTGKMEDEFAIHQLKTTANFATRNKIISWFCGGLNFQIEHHLFPKISHIHYPQISKIVKQACKEYGIEYIEYKRMTTAIASHVTYLKHVGKAA